MKRQIYVKYYAPVMLTALVLLTGCVSTAGYKKPISDFQNASSVVTDSARIYVNQLNKTERDAYIDRQVNTAKPILLTEIEKKQVFSPKEIQIRLDALSELSKYGVLLGKLANSDAPEKITNSAEDLAASLEKLVTDTGGTLSPSINQAFSGAIGPATQLMGEVARLVIEKKIQDALNKAILSGEEPVVKLIHTIRNDLIAAYERKRNAISANRVVYLDGYEHERRRITRNTERLRKRGAEIKSVLDMWESFPASNPSKGLDAMATAHTALVDYAKSPKNAADLTAFAAQMDAFVSRAKRVGKAVQQLQAFKQQLRTNR
uniref:Uncharacterized protein n=1 Tax=Candidatus Kentrum sp. MB TaxID=2138164 RepID=A0A451B9L3_9GAMM|nr:MAG: hypothetical protein BECKMB1821G_GA0114241_101133 [Candidatus Kentron sp. MB]VFK29847.1 MAG: hypothetical protein BECKMB1821I_GA0114274_101223 [Candidatus Kentron sp. MB]VFK74965.1 MAG: hypothetical protein BECKMB1821H_GA0114242_101323 [Candidatus Kentron sp. MB]